MKAMKNLTALILSAAIVPAMALSSTAFAESEYDMQSEAEEHAGQQDLSTKPAGALYGDDVIGKSVKHRESGEEIGSIEDLIIGEDGRVAGVVLSTGAFLGLGGQEVGLGWDELQQSEEDGEISFSVDMDEEQLRNQPEHSR